jgi:hypothetical protein
MADWLHSSNKKKIDFGADGFLLTREVFEVFLKFHIVEKIN